MQPTQSTSSLPTVQPPMALQGLDSRIPALIFGSSYIWNPRWMKESIPFPVTTIERSISSFLKALENGSSFLNDRTVVLPPELIQRMIHLLDKSIEINDKIYPDFIKRVQGDKIAKEVRQRGCNFNQDLFNACVMLVIHFISNLQSNQCIFLESGFDVYYLIKREVNDTYTFSIFNNNSSQTIVDKLKLKRIVRYKITNIDKKSITKSSALEKLYLKFGECQNNGAGFERFLRNEFPLLIRGEVSVQEKIITTHARPEFAKYKLIKQILREEMGDFYESFISSYQNQVLRVYTKEFFNDASEQQLNLKYFQVATRSLLKNFQKNKTHLFSEAFYLHMMGRSTKNRLLKAFEDQNGLKASEKTRFDKALVPAQLNLRFDTSEKTQSAVNLNSVETLFKVASFQFLTITKTTSIESVSIYLKQILKLSDELLQDQLYESFNKFVEESILHFFVQIEQQNLFKSWLESSQDEVVFDVLQQLDQIGHRHFKSQIMRPLEKTKTPETLLTKLMLLSLAESFSELVVKDAEEYKFLLDGKTAYNGFKRTYKDYIEDQDGCINGTYWRLAYQLLLSEAKTKNPSDENKTSLFIFEKPYQYNRFNWFGLIVYHENYKLKKNHNQYFLYHYLEKNRKSLKDKWPNLNDSQLMDKLLLDFNSGGLPETFYLMFKAYMRLTHPFTDDQIEKKTFHYRDLGDFFLHKLDGHDYRYSQNWYLISIQGGDLLDNVQSRLVLKGESFKNPNLLLLHREGKTAPIENSFLAITNLKGDQNFSGNVRWTAKATMVLADSVKFDEKRRGISLFDYIQFRYLDANEETLIPNILNYIMRNPSKLDDEDFLRMLNGKLFRSGKLENLIKSSPSFVESSQEQLKISYKKNLEIGNLHSALYFLYLNAQIGTLSAIVNSQKTYSGIAFAVTELKRLFETFSANSSTRQLAVKVARYLVAVYSDINKLSDEEIKNLLIAIFYFNTYGTKENWKDSLSPVVEVSMRHIQQLLALNLQKISINSLINSEDILGLVCNSILYKIIGVESDKWQYSGNGLIVDLSSDYKLDLLNGDVYKGKYVIAELPAFFRNHKNFIVLFGENLCSGTRADGAYYCTLQNDASEIVGQYRLQSDEKMDLKIEKLVDDEWYTYIPPEKICNFLPACYNYFWINKTHWFQVKSENQIVLLIASGKFHTLQYCLKQDTLNSALTRFKPADLVNEPLQNLEAYKKHPWIILLLKIEEEGRILIWGNSGIDLPRFGISFVIQNDKLYWTKNKEYFLVDRPQLSDRLRHLEFIRESIILEDKDGNFKVLIPRWKAKTVEWGAIKNKLAFEKTETEQSYFEYDVRSDNSLLGKTREQMLYLIYVHILHKKYEAVLNYLNPIIIDNSKDFSRGELEIIIWIKSFLGENAIQQNESSLFEELGITEVAKENKTFYKELREEIHHFESYDPSPELSAITLHLESLLLRTELKSDVNLSFIIQKLVHYYEKLTHIPSLVLKKDQEIELLKLVSNHKKYKFFQERLKELTQAVSVSTIKKSQAATPLTASSENFHLSFAAWLEKNQINLELRGNDIPALDPKLLEIFTENPSYPPIVNQEIMRVRASIVLSHKQQSEEKNLYVCYNTVTDISISDTSKAAFSEKEKCKKELLDLANKKPASDPDKNLNIDQVLCELEHEVGIRKTFTVDELIRGYLWNNLEALLKKNPTLTEEDKIEIQKRIVSYLVAATNEQQLNRLIKSPHDPIPKERGYDVDEERVFLVYEYYTDFTLRPDQLHLIRLMRTGNIEERKFAIHQLMMGRGKTVVILPLLAFLNSNGYNLPIFIVLEALAPSNIEEFKKTASLLGQEIEVLLFDDNTVITTAVLQDILQQFERIPKNRSFLVTTPRTLHILKLFYDSLCKQLREPLLRIEKAEVRKQFLLMSMIKYLLFKQGVVVLDEGDSALSNNKDRNLATGDPLQIDESISLVNRELFNQLVQDETYRSFFNITKIESSFNEQEYSKLKISLGEKLLDYIVKETRMKLSDSNRGIVLDYLSGKSSQVPSILEKSLQLQRNSNAVIKENLANILPFVLKRKMSQHFGFSKLLDVIFAIPYERSNTPSEGSEFSNYLETAFYTMWTYVVTGIPFPFYCKFIQQLKENILRECKNESIDLEDTREYKKFKNLIDPDVFLYALEKDGLRASWEKINGKIESRIEFASLAAVPSITYYPGKIASNAHNLVSMFHSFLSFTGTLNAGSFHHKLKVVPDAVCDGRVILELWRKKAQIVPVDSKTSECNPLFEKSNGYQASIDVASWFRGVLNSEVARQFLDYFTKNEIPIEGIGFFNERDIPEGTRGLPVILEKDNPIPVRLEDSKIPLEKRLTFYDFTVGANIKQSSKAKGLLTVDANTTLHEVLQGTLRFREFWIDQHIDFAIKKDLEQSRGLKELKNLLLFITVNQGYNLMKEGFKGLLQGLKNRLEEEVQKVIVDIGVAANEGTPDWDEIEKVTEAASEFLIETVETDVFKLLSPVTKEEDKKLFLDQHIKFLIGKFKVVYQKIPQLQMNCTLEGLSKDLHEISQSYLVADKVNVRSGQTLEGTQEVQKQIAVEVENEKEQTCVVEYKTDKPILASRGNLWVVPNDESGLSFFSKIYFNLKGTFIGGPVISMNRHLRRHADHFKDFPLFAQTFSKKLLLSNGYRISHYHPELENEQKEFSQLPFGSCHKPVTQCLLLMIDGKMQLILLAPDEAGFVMNMLCYDYLLNKNPKEYEMYKKYSEFLKKENREIQIAFIDPRSGLIIQGSDPISDQVFKSPEYIALVTQIKFWNGELEYTRSEKVFLKHWIKKMGPEYMENLFKKKIIGRFKEKLTSYTGSVIWNFCNKKFLLK